MVVLLALTLILSVAVIGLLTWVLILLGRVSRADATKMHVLNAWEEFKAKAPEREKAIRKDAIARSTSVVKGKVAEQFVPFTAYFGFNPRDCRFLGAPVDFVVFEGLTEGDLERVIFVEVKTGASRLSKRERQIRDALKNKEYVYLIYRMAEDGSGTWSS